jgi:hypothetical protein
MGRFVWAVILLASAWPGAAAEQEHWSGTWAATVGAGSTAFAGTWEAAPGASADSVNGTWSLRDANGNEVATGTWAAAKDGKVWKGTWQARRASGQVYDGEWQARADLPVGSPMPAMLEAAVAKAVSGSWRMGSLAGAWTIRVYMP